MMDRNWYGFWKTTWCASLLSNGLQIPFVLKADEWPLDVEDVVTDHIWFAVFDQELEVVHGFLNVLLMQHVADQTQVDIS